MIDVTSRFRECTHKQLPPFGRQVMRILTDPVELKMYSGTNKDGTRGTVWVATGPGAWDWKYRHPQQLTLVLPFGENPYSYYWGFLAGHEPPLILPPVADSLEMREALTLAMVRDGLLSVLAVGDSGFMKIYRDAA